MDINFARYFFLFLIFSTNIKCSSHLATHARGILDETKPVIKSWTVIIYMSADNDLAPFARKNLRQLAEVGSNNNINLLVQLDTRIGNNAKITKRYYIEKNKYIVTNQNDPFSQKMDSGIPETLVDCCRWAITNYPAHDYMLVLWNHGTGIIDIGRPRRVNPLPLFCYNPDSNLIELDRTINFLDFVQSLINEEQRGICFDDSTGHYLSNQNLNSALNEICTKYLGGNKFSIVAFDACLMAMIEIANIIKNYGDIMVASQEVELGSGYPYGKIFSPFQNQTLNKQELSQHIVHVYQQEYAPITNDFTQSALDLSKATDLESIIDTIGITLIECIKNQHNNVIKNIIKTCRSQLLCTCFDAKDYIDLHNFLVNIYNNLRNFKFTHEAHGISLKKKLSAALEEAFKTISSTVLAYTAGSNLKNARGISIYFPERKIHNSYSQTPFAANKWYQFLLTYLS